ncbi:MAG: class I SAM-dependent methyltransferase [Acidimicrobiia bacterium]
MSFSIDPEETEIRVIHELVDFSTKTVLEVGCGDGRMTWRYSERTASVLALDTNEEKIERAVGNTPEELRSRVRFVVADITDAALELPPDAFEVAILSHSL